MQERHQNAASGLNLPRDILWFVAPASQIRRGDSLGVGGGLTVSVKV